MSTRHFPAAFLLSTAMFLAVGCGEVDSSEYEDDQFTELADRVRAPAPHKPTAIERKYVSLPEGVKADYFAQGFGPGESLDSQGSRYKFYHGPLGLGAIYVVNGTAIAIKGLFLEEWARAGYENAPLMGYPRGDEVNGRQEFEPQEMVPEVENYGLTERRHYLVLEGDAVHHVFEDWYQDNNLPNGQLSTQPQTCRVIEVSALEGTALAALLDDPKYGGIIPTLWCGAPPGPWVPPQNAEWGDI